MSTIPSSDRSHGHDQQFGPLRFVRDRARLVFATRGLDKNSYNQRRYTSRVSGTYQRGLLRLPFSDQTRRGRDPRYSAGRSQDSQSALHPEDLQARERERLLRDERAWAEWRAPPVRSQSFAGTNDGSILRRARDEHGRASIDEAGVGSDECRPSHSCAARALIRMDRIFSSVCAAKQHSGVIQLVIPGWQAFARTNARHLQGKFDVAGVAARGWEGIATYGDSEAQTRRPQSRAPNPRKSRPGLKPDPRNRRNAQCLMGSAFPIPEETEMGADRQNGGNDPRASDALSSIWRFRSWSFTGKTTSQGVFA